MKFSLGNVVVTSEVNNLIENGDLKPFDLLSRYVTQDWGETSKFSRFGPSDWEFNDLAVTTWDRIVAWYSVNDFRVLIITEHDRSTTTIQLANEY